MKAGAFDFIEKPLREDAQLESIDNGPCWWGALFPGCAINGHQLVAPEGLETNLEQSLVAGDSDGVR